MRITSTVVSHHAVRRVLSAGRRTRRQQAPTGIVFGRRFPDRKTTSSLASASPSASDVPPPPVPPRGFMEFAKFLRAVPNRFPLLERDFTLQAAHHPDLAAYPTLDALVRALRSSAHGGLPDRKPLIASIVKAHQAKPHPVWSTVLLRVFSSVIWKLRIRLIGGDADTRDEILLEETQHALLKMKTTDPARIFMYFKQRLRRRVFHALAVVTDWENVGFGSDAEEVADPTTIHPPRLLGHWLRTAPSEQTELVATFVDHEGLHGLVRRMASSAEEHDVVHARLRKRRERLVESLREKLGDASTRAKNFSEH